MFWTNFYIWSCFLFLVSLEICRSGPWTGSLICIHHTILVCRCQHALFSWSFFIFLFFFLFPFHSLWDWLPVGLCKWFPTHQNLFIYFLPRESTTHQNSFFPFRLSNSRRLDLLTQGNNIEPKFFFPLNYFVPSFLSSFFIFGCTILCKMGTNFESFLGMRKMIEACLAKGLLLYKL